MRSAKCWRLRTTLPPPLFKGIADFKSTRIAMLRAETIDELFGILNNIPEQFNIGAKKIDLHQI